MTRKMLCYHRRAVERRAVVEGAVQHQILTLGPDEGACRRRRIAGLLVDLLRYEAGRSGKLLKRGEDGLRSGSLPGNEIVHPALPGEDRPRVAVIVGVVVAVVVIAMPGRP